MSSVGSSDGSNRSAENDSVRRKYEDFRQNESELVKKHQKEIRRLNESHYAEVERLKEDHSKQMASMSQGSSDAISKRDHRYNKEIEDVRGLHRKQMQTMAEENQRREEALRSSIGNDMDASKISNDARFEKLNADYDRSLNKQEKMFQDGLAESREAQQTAVRKNHEKLTAAHAAETKAMREDRDKTLGSIQRQYDDYRKFTAEEKRTHQIQDLQNSARSSDNLMNAVNKERNARVDSEEILRDGFQDGLEKMRERYDGAIKKERGAQKLTNESLKSGVVNRVDNQVRRLENEVVALKENNTRQELKLKNKMQRELSNYRDSTQKNIENLQDQRDEAVQASKESNRKDVQKVRGELEDQLVHNNRFYRERMEEQNRINRTSYDRLKGDFEARVGATKENTDNRIKHIVGVMEEQKERLVELNADNHATNQRLKADQMRALRVEMESDKEASVNRLQDMMRKQELNHTERMNSVVAKYEKQIQGLKDMLLKERKSSDENMKRMSDEMTRLHKLEIDQVEAKNREKVRQLGTQHSNEIRTVNKRHEERLDQVLGEIKKT